MPLKSLFEYVMTSLRKSVDAVKAKTVRVFPYFFGLKKHPSQPHLFGNITTLRSLKEFKNIAIMAGYQPESPVLSPHVHKYIQELKHNGFGVVFLNAHLHERQLNSVDVSNALAGPKPDIYLCRVNLGLDFGSWADFTRALHQESIRLSDYQEVLLCNDSMYGPLASLDDIFQKIRSSSADVVGLTDSYQLGHHLQSYFLHFKSQILQGGFLDKYLSELPFYLNKDFLIEEVETRLASKVRCEGYQTEALFPYFELSQKQLPSEDIQKFIDDFGAERYFSAQNPTHFYAATLVQDHKFPFVKRELLDRNPFRMNQAKTLQPLVDSLFEK